MARGKGMSFTMSGGGLPLPAAPSSEEEVGDAPEWVPENAVGYTGFGEVGAYAGGEVVSIENFFGAEDATGWGFSSFYDGEAIVDGAYTPSDAGVLALAGAAKSGFASGGTIVVKGTIGETGDKFIYFLSADRTQGLYANVTTGVVKDASNATIIATDGYTAPAGEHAVAMTVSPTRVAISINGRTALTATGTFSGIFPPSVFMDWISDFDAMMSLVASYSEQLDADLPALSVPPSGS